MSALSTFTAANIRDMLSIKPKQSVLPLKPDVSRIEHHLVCMPFKIALSAAYIGLRMKNITRQSVIPSMNSPEAPSAATAAGNF